MAPGRLSSSADSQRAPSDFDDTTIAASSSRSSKCPKCNSHRRPSWEDRPDQKYPPLDQPLHGWPELAKAIETYADFEAFPAFRDLNIKSLLYYQCELTALRKKLHEQEWEDHRSHFEDAPKFNSRVDFLLLSEPPPQPQHQGDGDDEDDEEDDETHEQMELINKIRIVLEKYNHALLQYSQINALPAADRFNVDSLHKWLTNSKLGDTVITGPGAETWGKLPRVPPSPEPLISQFLHLFMFWSKKKEEFRKDLVVPRSPEKVDGLTHWVANEFVPFWQNVRLAYQAWKKKSRAQESCLPNHDVPNAMLDKEGSIASVSTFKRRFSNLLGSKRPFETTSVEMSEDTLEVPPTLNTYSMNSMIRFTSRVATIIACLFPTVGIAVLAKIHDTGMVIGFIALFTFLFAAGLMALTNFGTSRTEIFTATAAFSAVLVVFVQNQTG